MQREKEILKVSKQGIFINLTLVVFKAIIGFLSNSIAIILDAVNNLSDAVSSLITMIGTKLAGKKPDKKHPYGYGRIEYITSTIIGIIIFIAGFTSLRESLDKIFNPVEVDYQIPSLIIIGVAVIVKFFFGKYVKSKGEVLNSSNLVASGTDAYMDSILSFSTLVAAMIYLCFHTSLEGYLGVILSIFILKSAFDILKDTLNSILGERADVSLTRDIKKKITQFEEVEGVYDLVLHNYGPTEMMGSAHIQVRDDMTAKELHTLTKKIQLRMYKEFGIIFTIGIYASNTDKEEYKEIKKKIQSLASKHKEILQTHGFYVDEEARIISIDVIFDFEAKNPSAIKSEIESTLKKEYPMYQFYITMDIDYSE